MRSESSPSLACPDFKGLGSSPGALGQCYVTPPRCQAVAPAALGSASASTPSRARPLRAGDGRLLPARRAPPGAARRRLRARPRVPAGGKRDKGREVTESMGTWGTWLLGDAF